MKNALVCVMGMALAGVSGCGLHAQMHDMPRPAKAPSSPSTNLTLTLGGKTTSLSVADLQAMPQKTVAAHNAHSNTDESYTGVPLADLLAKYGFSVDKSTHQQMLRSYIKAEGTDKYWVLFSITEIEPTEHNGTVLIALTLGGKPLGADGRFKLIDTEDKKPERWVHNLTALSVITAE